MNAESVYLRLPVFLQQVACSVNGWQLNHHRYGRGFYEHLRRAEQRLRWTSERLLEYRDRRIHEFVEHCAQTVPYYQKLFKEHGVDPRRIRGLEDLKQVPILSKATVQAQHADLQSCTVPRRQRVMTHTSGTTGGGLRFFTTRDAIQCKWATWWRYRRLHGIAIDTWCGYFGGRSVVPPSQSRPPFWRYNLPGRQIVFSGYHLSPKFLPFYVSELRRRKPPWLHGYPSVLTLIASYLLEHEDDLGYPVRWVTVGAESLLPQQANVIARAFGTQPLEHYGMAEAIANCFQCLHRNLHVDEDYAGVEFLPNEDGPGCRVIGTNFTNPATPLVRYDVGDVAELGSGPCPCGLPGRIVHRVDGRQEDYVVLRDGTKLGRMDHVFKDLTAICEAQIFQDTPGIILVRLVRNPSYGPADEKLLLHELHQRVGPGADVRIEYVESIERSATGKLRFVVSAIPEGRLV